jgi:hypothetical protein
MRLVKSKAKPMAVGGTLISGTLMAALASAYVKAVNEGEPPVVTCAALASTACRCLHHVSMRCVLHVRAVRSFESSHRPATGSLGGCGNLASVWCPAHVAGLRQAAVLPAVCGMSRCCAPAGDCMAGCVTGRVPEGVRAGCSTVRT